VTFGSALTMVLLLALVVLLGGGFAIRMLGSRRTTTRPVASLESIGASS